MKHWPLWSVDATDPGAYPYAARPLVTAPTTPFALWWLAPLFFHTLHCAWNTEGTQTICISDSFHIHTCIPGVWTATRIIKRNMISLGRWMLLFYVSKVLFFVLLKLPVQTLVTCKGHRSDILENHHSCRYPPLHPATPNAVNNNKEV